MSELKLGMRYEDVRRRVKRIITAPTGNKEAKSRLVDSLLNQVRLGEDETAQNEIAGEIANMHKRSSSFSGAGNRQVSCCMKFDCENRDDSCNDCYRWNCYIPKGSALLSPVIVPSKR